MRVVILAYDGIDLWDLAMPYELLRQCEEFEVVVVCNNEDGTVCLKDRNTSLVDLKNIKNVEHADILWICSGDASIEDQLKNERLKIDIGRLALGAKKVIAVGAASTFLAGSLISEQRTVSCHPSFASKIKKVKVNCCKDLIIENDKFITTSARAGVFIASFILIAEFADPVFRNELFIRYGFDKNLLNLDMYSDNKTRIRNLKKLYKQTISRKKKRDEYPAVVDSTSKSVCFYIHQGFNVLSFALFYSVISNHQLLDLFLVSDKKGSVKVEGGGFSIMCPYSLHQIKRVHTLVIAGGGVVESRLQDAYLKYWIFDIVSRCSRVITFEEADRLLGVSGALAEYDPAFEEEDADTGKFILFENTGYMLNWLRGELATFTNDSQAALYLSEYFA